MKDNTAPATKADIAALMDSIGKLYDANERWKNEILSANERWKNEILTANERWKNEIIQYFEIAVGQIRHDLLGANRDEIELLKDGQADHGRRITKLERHTGIAA